MGVLRKIARDTLTLARVLHGQAGPAAVAAAVAHDSAQVLALSRLREAAARWHVPIVGGVLRRMQAALFGVEIARDVQLGEGVIFAHTVGIVIGGDSRIGDRVMFLGSNTIGNIKKDGFPRIGNDVVIGAGARVLGPVTIGDGAVIGANAVVVRNVPAGATAAGVPAVVRLRGEDRGNSGSTDSRG
jgi:serine O-acetyltransferase